MNDDLIFNGDCYSVDLSASPPLVRRWNRETLNWVKARLPVAMKRHLVERWESRNAFMPNYPRMMS